MKKVMMLGLSVVTLAVLTGCQKKESAEAPMQQPMVSEQQPATGAAMTPTAATEAAPAAAVTAAATPATVATAAVTEAAAAAAGQVAAATVERPTPQQIHQALKNAGLYSGKVDGSLGPKTKKAIEEFQAKNGLNADGKVGAKTWSKLGTHLNGAAAVATEPIMPADTSATGTTSAEPSN
jgi:peptidoglycan hydrolase-like protein with peptidoglycan-binding domain